VISIPKTLVLSWSVPPAATGSGIVMLNFLRQFKQDEMVVVGALYSFHPRTPWSDDLPRIIYGMIQPPFTWHGERWLRRLQWPVLLLISLWVFLRNKCQAILVIYPDELFLLAGYLISRFTRRPLFVYFHNTYVDNNPDRFFAHWLQERVFAAAKHVFVMSEGMRQLFSERYPNLDCSALPHIINEPIVSPNEVKLPSLHTFLRLVFAGNINASCAEAAGRFLQWFQQTPDVTLTIYSGMPSSLFERLGFCGERISFETVPYHVLLNRIRQGDVLIHPHGFTGLMQPVEYRTIFPTKTLEYLVSQRPILAHLPRECYLAQFYRKHDCALIVDEPTIEALSKGMARLSSDPELRLRLVRNALKAAVQFQGTIVARNFREKMAYFTS
jgi:glycosyltransferase involved in cell wall biosynthesis